MSTTSHGATSDRERGASPPASSPSSPSRTRLAALLAVAAVLRLIRLDGQLWLDEVSALRGYTKSFWETLTTFPVFFPNPLYELMAHAAVLAFGVEAWAIRLPAALFGVAGVLAFYALALRCLDARTALLAALLLAVSYHHVFYSQDARGYTTYLCLALLATERLLAFLAAGRPRSAAAYVVLVALATYAHPFGLFLLAGQMPVAFVVAAARRARAAGEGRPGPVAVAAVAALGAAAVLLLYAPLVGDALRYAAGEARSAGHGPRVTMLLPELLAGLRDGFGGWSGLLAALVLGGLGSALFVRRQPLAFALLATPLVVAALAVMLLGAGVHPRYFLLALPLGYLVASDGVMLVVRALARRPLPGRRVAAARLELAALLALVVVASLPLAHYYRHPKQDFRGGLAALRELASGDDRIAAAAHAGRAAQLYYDPQLPVAADAAALRELEASGRRIWLMVTLERELRRSDPELFAHLRRHYRRVRYLPGTIGDGGVRIYLREPGG